MTDWDALQAMNGLIRVYQAEARGKPQPELKLTSLHQEIFDGVQSICEWRLGRAQLSDENEIPLDVEFENKTLEEIVLCLKRVRRSIEMWNKDLGRRGYFSFVSDYVG